MTVHDLHESGAQIAASYGIKTVPAVSSTDEWSSAATTADPTVKNSLKQARDGRRGGPYEEFAGTTLQHLDVRPKSCANLRANLSRN